MTDVTDREAILAFLFADGRTPFRRITTVLGSKHKLTIIYELARRRSRFKELERALAPVTPKVLTRNLRELEDLALITRHSFDEVPPRVEYALSPLGESLRPHILALCHWAYDNADALSSAAANR